MLIYKNKYCVDEDFSFCLYPYIRRKYSFKSLRKKKEKKKILECRQDFTTVNNMAFSGLWENITLTKVKM